MRGCNRGRTSTPAGITLVELIIALVITAVIGSALVALFVGQSRLFGHQESLRSARSVARKAANVLFAELRMVETNLGVEAATPTSLTLRVPYALGVLCSSGGSEAIVSLLPVDSVMYANAGYTGYAWRDANEKYVYITANQATPQSDTDGTLASVCTGASVTTLTSEHGRVVRLTPGPKSGSPFPPVGTPVFLYQRIRYEFKTSAQPGGGTVLVRTDLETGVSEELVGPFEASGTKFRFYVDGIAAAQDAAPADLSTIRGIELAVEGVGDRPAATGGGPATAPFTTAVFFKNQSN